MYGDDESHDDLDMPSLIIRRTAMMTNPYDCMLPCASEVLKRYAKGDAGYIDVQS